MESSTILESITTSWAEFLYSLKPSVTFYILQMGLLLAMTTAMAFLAWAKLGPLRSTLSQLLVALCCFSVILQIPLGQMRAHDAKGIYAFQVTMALLLMIFLPRLLAFFLTRRLIWQIRLTKIITGLMWLLLVVQFFV